MKRIIKNYSNIQDHHLAMIAEAFPEGFGDEDLQSMSLADGRIMRCLEVRTEETIYLFRIDKGMIEMLEENMDDSFDIGSVDEEALEEED